MIIQNKPIIIIKDENALNKFLSDLSIVNNPQIYIVNDEAKFNELKEIIDKRPMSGGVRM